MSIDFIFGACDVIALKELYQPAFEIAIKDKITVYDALFVAASERENAPLLTTDGKLYEKIKNNRNVKQI